jgi:hypothetical protein
MGITESLFSYASDFEKTFADDDWSRLAPYFHEDAVYEVSNVFFACEVKGPEAIFKALRKSIDSFDRRMDDRTIDVLSGPETSGDEIRLGWAVTYAKAGAPDFVLRGESIARFEGDRIIHLRDRYPDGHNEEIEAWIHDHAPDLDPSYV